MDWHVWLAYFVASWVIAVSPGSGAVLAMSHGLAYGVRGASATVLGLQIGLAFILLVAGAGVGAVLVASAGAFMVVKLLGAAYLLWLGFKQWRAPVTLDDGGAQAGPPVMRLRQRVLTGALTNATNPKGIVFMVAVLPQFMTDARPLWMQLLVMAATSLVIDLTVMHGYALGASSLRRMMQSPRAMRNQNRVFGGVLMAVGAGLFFVKRGGAHA